MAGDPAGRRKGLVKSAGDLLAYDPGIGWPNECKRRGSQSRFAARPGAGEGFVGEQLRELGFDGGAEPGPIDLSGNTFENQPLDVEVDAHARTCAPFRFSQLAGNVGSSQRSSDSLTGRSSLRNSARAAARTNGMVTPERASAAVKQALSPTL